VPDLSPIGILAVAGIAIFVALGIAGAAAGHWETFLLWRNQVPFSTDATKPVVDPVFGRDISFYLFELPFLRLVQGVATTLVVGSLLAAAARYAIAAARDGLNVATPIRLHLGVLGALVLVSFAVGYQLDK